MSLQITSFCWVSQILSFQIVNIYSISNQYLHQSCRDAIFLQKNSKDLLSTYNKGPSLSAIAFKHFFFIIYTTLHHSKLKHRLIVFVHEKELQILIQVFGFRQRPILFLIKILEYFIDNIFGLFG